MLRQLRLWGGKIVRRRMRRQADAYLNSAKYCVVTQQQTLSRILRLNADSEYSKKLGLSDGLSVAEFRRRMPVSDFEAIRPYVEKMKNGDHRALLGPDNPLLMFALSSGTTSETKFIPVTKQFLSDYRRGWQVWGINAFESHGFAVEGDIVQISSDYDQFRTPGGTPCGNISGLVSAMQSPVVRSMYTIPLAVSKITDPEAKSYTAMRLAIANPRVGVVMTANPSTLVQWGLLAEARAEDLIRDVRDGTNAAQEGVTPEVRKLLGRRITRKDPARARFLEGILKKTNGMRPADFWPQLSLLGVWTGGSVGFYMPQMRKYFGEVPVRDHGLSASEGRMTIPLADSTSSGVLDVGSHFFEFIPEEEYGQTRPTILQAHQLTLGQNYYILLTTCSGLYRYDIRDVVRCTGYYGSTPTLEFLHKGAHISNLTGEKISESQVVTAVRASANRLRVDVDCFTLAPAWGEPPRYKLHVEHAGHLSGPHFHAPHAELVRLIDEELQDLNCEYKEKRKTGRLAPVEVSIVPEGTWNRFARQRQSKLGGSAEQYKHPCLVPDLHFEQKLSGIQGPKAAAGDPPSR